MPHKGNKPEARQRPSQENPSRSDGEKCDFFHLLYGHVGLCHGAAAGLGLRNRAKRVLHRSYFALIGRLQWGGKAASSGQKSVFPVQGVVKKCGQWRSRNRYRVFPSRVLFCYYGDRAVRRGELQSQAFWQRVPCCASAAYVEWSGCCLQTA